ncbi:CHAT domain-containing protein [Actinomadura sp. NTSP31]|uniref:CHAT domain-containing protein n=1 Tax=Actinomadura sp. NTSP31 TaxID=1735447 RepID=UPI0035C1B94C
MVVYETLFKCAFEWKLLCLSDEARRSTAEELLSSTAADETLDTITAAMHSAGTFFWWRYLAYGSDDTSDDLAKARRAFSSLTGEHRQILPQWWRSDPFKKPQSTRPPPPAIEAEVNTFLLDAVETVRKTPDSTEQVEMIQAFLASVLRSDLYPEDRVATVQVLAMSTESAYGEGVGARTLVAVLENLRHSLPDSAQSPLAYVRVAAPLIDALRLRYEATGGPGLLDEAKALIEAIDLNALPQQSPYWIAARLTVARALDALSRQVAAGDSLDQALSLFDEIVENTPPDDARHLWCAAKVGNVLESRFRLHHSQADVERLIAARRKALAGDRLGSDDQSSYQRDLAIALRLRREHTEDGSDLIEEIRMLRAALSASADDAATFDLNIHLFNALAFQAMDSGSSPDEGIRLGREILQNTSQEDPNRSARLSNLSWLLFARFITSRLDQDLLEAESLAREATAGLPRHDPQRYIPKLTLCLVMAARTEHFSEEEVSRDELDSLYEWVLLHVPKGYSRIPLLLSTLYDLIRAGHVSLSNPAALDRALTLAKEVDPALRDVGPLALLRPSLLTLRFSRNSSAEDAEEALRTSRRSVDDAPTPAEYSRRLANYCRVLEARFSVWRDKSDLDELISACTVGRDRTDTPDRIRLEILERLATAHSSRYLTFGDPKDASEAAHLYRRACESTLDKAGQHERLASLALAISRDPRQSASDLDEGVAAARRAIELADVADADSTRALDIAQIVLRTRFERLGTERDLYDAVELGLAALERAQERNTRQPYITSNLCATMRSYYIQTGELAALDDAVRYGREAVDATEPSDPDRPARLSNLGAALRLRYARTRSGAELNEVIELHREAVRTSSVSEPGYLISMGNLASALLTRKREGDLGEALDNIYLVIDQIRPRDAIRPNIVLALMAAVSAPDIINLPDLERAISIARETIGTIEEDHYFRPLLVSNLSGLLGHRYRLTNVDDDFVEALDGYQEAARVESMAPDWKMTIHTGQADLAASRAMWEVAASAFASATELLPVFIWAGTSRLAQEQFLSRWHHLVPATIVCTAFSGQPELALRLAEFARGLLFQQSSDLRDDFSPLRERSPDLADRLFEIRQRLDASVGGAVTEAGSITVADSALSHARLKLFREWNSLLEQVRSRPGSEDFLRPPTIDELVPAARNGPVIVLASSDYGSVALIVTNNGVRLVRLPQLSRDDAVERVFALHRSTALLHAGSSDNEVRAEAKAQRVLRATLTWMWESAVQPILADLKTQDYAGRKRRIWWCPIGMLAFLPWHAAGTFDSGESESILNTAISSYTPTLKSLARSADEIQDPEADTALIVAMPKTPRMGDLPSATHEAESVGNLVPGSEIVSSDRATRNRVIDGLRHHSYAHFACHAEQDPLNPFASKLILVDGTLDLSALADMRLPNSRLAYLSCCNTLVGGFLLSDESVHLASAFQVAGYQHVVATLWPVMDAVAADVAELFYRAMLGNQADGNVGHDPALSLHTAVETLRRRYPQHPLYWAAHVHTGP